MALSAPAMKRSRKAYVYEKLSDLRPDSKGVNVMGVVALFKPPYKSRGSDFTCTIEIVDEECQTNPVPVIFFNRDMDKLPRSCNIGDVLCVRRVDIGEFNSRLQGKCRNFVSWLLWDGQREGRREPAATSAGVSWDHEEMDRADQLIRWSHSLNSDLEPSCSHNPPPAIISPLRTSATLKPVADLTVTDKKINFVGIVKTVTAPQKSKGPDYFITVTLVDETSPAEGFNFTFFNPIENQLPKVADQGSAAFLSNINIFEYQDGLMGRGHQRSHIVCFSLQPDGEVKAITGDDCEVADAVMERAKALLEWAANCQSLFNVEDSELDFQSQIPPADVSTAPSHSDTQPSFVPPTSLTLMLHPTWNVSALKDVQASSTVPSCFHVRVKVLQVLQPLDECCQLRCPKCKYRFPLTEATGTECNNCARKDKDSSAKLRFMFCFSLLIQDATATCHAHLSDTDADEFFQGLLPANLHENPTTRKSLLAALTTLTGRQEPFLPVPSPSVTDKSRPWIDCCVLSYSSSKGTQLRIVDTWFLHKV